MNSASKITIITDSASDMPGNLHNQVTVLPMTISFGDEQFEDGVTLSADEFYMKLIESDTLPKTSQVSPFAFTSAYETALTHSDAVIVITLSSKSLYKRHRKPKNILSINDLEDCVREKC